ncbi:hypothetical protein EDB83DRAFT_2232775 [Lactarius deliciosus]|nr:hypothetical protein EDB83DRAFT_2232775 [Lactarius deliciosus]
MNVDTDDRAPAPDTSVPLQTETPDHPQQSRDRPQQDGAPFVERFPSEVAGAPISEMGRNTPGYQALRDDLGPGNIWYPFQSQCDWDFARWAKNRGSSSTAVTELLAINGVVEKLELSYHNMKELNRIIDEEMPGRPKFKCEKICIGGESYDFHFREVIPCIRALFGDPRYSGRLVFAPERHYRDAGCTTQVFGEMYTGKWWWSVQQSLELRKPGATVLPLIISSDKTQLTHFRSKSAYPVYLSIGNIPKDIRSKPTQQAQMLMGYIPATQLKQITNQAARRRALGNLFHSCMRKLLNPIESYGVTGIAMATGDGIWYRCHPILATFIGDYPEQLLVTCTYNGRCPKCTVPRGELGTDTRFPLRNFGAAVGAFSLSDGNPTTFQARCHDAGLKPTYHPFWERLPYANIFLSITPDILHQLHQGVLKHLVRWLAALRSGEIDARCSRLPPNHNARYFHKGITWLSKLTGKEHKDIARIILGVVVDLSLPGVQSSARLTRAVRALLDFIYLSQYPVHTTQTLNAMDNALCRFHENKDVFIELGVRKHFNLPKLHSLLHYTRSITLFGTADNYNTENSERLHIDLTKNAYRATNFKDEYKQMTTWLERQEAMHQHAAFIEWCNCGHLALSTPLTYPRPNLMLHPFLTIHPSEKGITFGALFNRYGAVDFQDALADFIVQHNYPELSASIARRRANNTLIPFRKVSVFHRVKFTNRGDTVQKTVDVLHIRPEARNHHGDTIPGRFDTALVKDGSRFRVAQIRVVFQLPRSALSSIFLSSRPAPPTDLAYVEWFSPLSTPNETHGMYRISRSYRNNRRLASIIPLAEVCRSVQLFPAFGPVAPRQWQGPTVLEECRTFYINSFLDRHLYQNLNVINENC